MRSGSSRPRLPSTDSGVYFGTEVSDIIDEVSDICAKLGACEDLSPGEEVNKLFSRLVQICIAPRSSDVVETVLGNGQIKRLATDLQRLCSEGEGKLESFWANRIIDCGSLDVSKGEEN